MSSYTPGPLRVVITSTCSGAWPQIVQDCIDPDTNEEWQRGLGSLNTAFVERSPKPRGLPAPYDEKPERFVPTEGHDEAMANAYLWAAAPELLAVARDVERLLAAQKWCVDGADPESRVLAAARAAIAAATRSAA